MKKLRGLQTYKSIAFSYKQIPLTHFIIRRFPFSFLNTLPSVKFFGKIYDLIDSACLGIDFPIVDENGKK